VARKYRFRVEGIITALLTPLTEEERVKEEAYRELIDFQVKHGVHGFFPLGTAGEGMKLSLEKRKRAAEVVVDRARGRMPIILHIGTQDTEMTVELAEHARGLGVDAVSAVGPFFYTPDTPGLIRHYRRVGEAADLPLFVYNNTQRQGYNIGPEAFGEITEAVPQVVGVKDTSYRVDQLQEYVRRYGRDYTVIGAGDSLTYANFAVGAVAHISAVSNVFPEVFVQLYEAVRRGDHRRARELQFRINEIRGVLERGPYITPYKEALRLRGIDVGTVSSPLRPMTGEEREALRKNLKALGVI